MATAKDGDLVKVHYTGTLTDGSEFDSSRDSDPLEFKLGEGQVIPGFEDCVKGMAPGDSKTITIPPDEAYGERSDEMVGEIDRKQFPDDMEPEEGMQLQSQDPDGNVIMFTVMSFNDETVTIDANHPLAGETLTFAIDLVAIG